jgi:hypothetical protein
MVTPNKRLETAIKKIKELVISPGYIYALCMIFFEDFRVHVEKMHEIDYRKRLSTNEASLLLGFMVQNEIDFSAPENPQTLISLKEETYKLMKDLHDSLMDPFFKKLKKNLEVKTKEGYRKDQKEFFGKGEMLVEPIFYSGSGAYDFQYLEFLEKKYKYDEKWLAKNKAFGFAKAKKNTLLIKSMLEKKSKKVRLFNLREKIPSIVEEMKKKNPNEDWEKQAKEMSPLMELYQYEKLFSNDGKYKKHIDSDEVRKKGWKSFYKNLIELFIVRKEDFNKDNGVEMILDNFYIVPEKGMNAQFETIGNYNLINSHPIIKLDEERYFVPITFLLFQALYESPFYWMLKDKQYRDQLSENRGRVSEEMVYEFLVNVFGDERTFKALKVKSPETSKSTKKEKDETDIDVLCVLGSKALCIQVKSKKLTELSRTGDDEKLQEDFKKAIQDAYEQGLVSRQKILKGGAKLMNKEGKQIVLSEEIDEVYLMTITTENYPSLTHQTHVMLDKKEQDPFPIALTVFDIELLVHYLDDPYDFMYYIRQRVSLMDYFVAEEEMSFLGFHLSQKLWKTPKVDRQMISSSYAQLIDRNYYPFKVGLDVSEEGDVIKQRWKNEKFSDLCSELKSLNKPKIVDILFYLFDWSGDARKNLVDFIVSTKEKTTNDGRAHDFSMPPDYSYFPRVGVTYISINSDNKEELRKRLLALCQARKYKSKGDVWIGFGSLKNSPRMVDAVVFNDQKWEYDKNLEDISKVVLDGRGTQVRLGKKIGRNKKCPCGSNLKYKKCCLH